MERAIILVILCTLCCCSALVSCSGISADTVQSECLKVPASEFAGSLKSTIDTVRQVTYAVSKFTNFTNDFRLSNAVKDCLDLLDLSSYNLERTLAASQGKIDNAAKLSSDLRTWLSAALVNQEICSEGFEGTDGMIKNMVGESLNQVSSSVSDILRMVRPVPVSEGGGDEFPAWLTKKDQQLLQATGFEPNAVVSLDGTGNFTSINDAIASVPDGNSNRFIIHIKKGVYREYVEIGVNKRNVMLRGDGIGATVITGNRNYADGWSPSTSATLGVKADGFIARDLTFQNTADATAVFQNGTILSIKGGLPKQKNTVTAQGRDSGTEPTSGFSIQFSNISAEPGAPETYLGWPWKPYSTTVVLQSYISGAIDPKGWLEWNSTSPVDLLYYAEYQNYGPGAGVEGRVTWPGYHVIKDPEVANRFTVAQFIVGNFWLRATGVDFTLGLSPVHQ